MTGAVVSPSPATHTRQFRREITMTEKTYTIDEIRSKITSNRRWTERAIVVLFEYQTADEKQSLQTVHTNKVGFNGMDAAFLSDLAKRLKSGRHLTNDQLSAAQRMIGKYASQLIRIIEKKNEPLA